MPGEQFYEGLQLPEAARKMADHHAAPNTRHLSFFEYQLLHRLADELERPSSVRKARARQADDAWSLLEQAYWTAFSSPGLDSSLEVYSIPGRLEAPTGVFARLLNAAEEVSLPQRTPPSRRLPASTVALEAAVGSLFISARPRASAVDIFDEFSFLASRPSLLMQQLNREEIELVNRALYQPSIPIEQSRPTFTSLQDLISGAGGGIVALADLPDVGYAVILRAGVGVIVIRVSLAIAERLAEMIHEFRRHEHP